MATFNYKAIDKAGLHAQGQMDALNEADLEIRLTGIIGFGGPLADNLKVPSPLL